MVLGEPLLSRVGSTVRFEVLFNKFFFIYYTLQTIPTIHSGHKNKATDLLMPWYMMYIAQNIPKEIIAHNHINMLWKQCEWKVSSMMLRAFHRQHLCWTVGNQWQFGQLPYHTEMQLVPPCSTDICNLAIFNRGFVFVPNKWTEPAVFTLLIV